MRTTVIVALGLGWAAGCSKGKNETGPREAAPVAPAIDAGAVAVAVDAAPAVVDAAVAAALPADCAAPLAGLRGLIGRMHGAQDPSGPRAKAIEAWGQMPRPCQHGAWFLAAAQLERWAPVKLVAGGVIIERADEALVAGLAANDDRGVLVLTGFAAALGSKPLLPKDACARATSVVATGPDAADQLAYVCAHAALAAGDVETAAIQLAAIGQPARYPDYPLRLAQVEARRGNLARAKELAGQAAKLDERAARGFGATDRERAKLVADAKALR